MDKQRKSFVAFEVKEFVRQKDGTFRSKVITVTDSMPEASKIAAKYTYSRVCPLTHKDVERRLINS